jgi:hypothetical protein
MRTIRDKNGVEWRLNKTSSWSLSTDIIENNTIIGISRIIDILSIECIPNDGGSPIYIDVPNLPLDLLEDSLLLYYIEKELEKVN